MRINEKTYPAIQAMISGEAERYIPLLAEDALVEFREKKITPRREINAIASNTTHFRQEFLKSMFFVSKSFEAAADRARPSLTAIYNSTDRLEISGTYIFPESVAFMFLVSICGKSSINVFCVYSKGGKALLYYFLHPNNDNEPHVWVSKALKSENVNIGSDLEISRYLASRIVLIELFRRHADVNSVVVEPKKKKSIGNENLLNETALPVTYLDCRWFTNIIRSNGFAVRGHFRLQPKKIDGEWTKELIWINDFEKHGYHSKARILNEQN